MRFSSTFILTILISSIQLSYALGHSRHINNYYLDSDVKYKYTGNNYTNIAKTNNNSSNKGNKSKYVGYHPGIINTEISDNLEVGLAPYGPNFKMIF